MSESKLSSPSQCESSNSLNARFGCCNILGTSLALRRKQWFAKCYFFSCFCSSSQKLEAWFSTKVDEAVASL